MSLTNRRTKTSITLSLWVSPIKKHEDRHKVKKPVVKSYSFVQEVPEYTKVVEAENIQSQVDAEVWVV